MNAGKDISHWFEPRTFEIDDDNVDVEVLLWFHPTMRINTYYTPQVRTLGEECYGLVTKVSWTLLFAFEAVNVIRFGRSTCCSSSCSD